MSVIVVVVVSVVVVVRVRVSVGMDCVNVCLKGVRVIMLVLRRRVWAVLATRFVVSVQEIAIRGSLPDVAAIRVGEGVLCVGRSR
jgi:hypothetical protein